MLVLISWNLSQIYKILWRPIFMVRNTCWELQVTLFRVSLVAYMVIKTCLLRKEYVLLVHEAVVNLVQSWKIPKDKHLVLSFAYSKLYYISTEHDNLEQIMQIWIKGGVFFTHLFLITYPNFVDLGWGGACLLPNPAKFSYWG